MLLILGRGYSLFAILLFIYFWYGGGRAVFSLPHISLSRLHTRMGNASSPKVRGRGTP
jgi:hypothetical protein